MTFIFFIPIFSNVIGLFDKYSILSSYKFFVFGIQAKRLFSYIAYVLFIVKENDFNSVKSDIEFLDI